MPHRFNPKDWEILESDWRKSILPVDRALDILKGLERREVAFDIGAGTGYFTEPLSRIFKRVYAVEVSLELARILASKGLKNVGIIISERPPDIDFNVDLVTFVDSLHEIDCKEEYADWCSRHAKYVLVIDWKKDAEVGPPREDRLDERQVMDIFNDFKFKRFDLYKYHYVLLGECSP